MKKVHIKHAHYTDYDVFSCEDQAVVEKMKKNVENVALLPSPRLTLAVLLSCGLTIVLSIVYTVLSSLAIHYRSVCDAGIATLTGPGSRFFLNTLLRLYFKQNDCSHSLMLNLDVTQEQTIFVLACVTLTLSLVCLLLAVAFISVVCIQRAVLYIGPVGYCYVVAIILSIAVELTMAVLFGMDYTTFGQEMNNSSPGVSANYVRDMYRMGALLLLLISLKGGIVPVLNIVFITLITFGLIEFRQKAQKEEHSMHKEGALRAFDQTSMMDEKSENSYLQNRTQPKRNNDIWQTNSTIYRGGHVEEYPRSPSREPPRSPSREPPRSPSREPPRSDYTNPSFDRSYSWHHSQPSVASRPFSYLEDIKRQPQLKSTGAIQEPQWQNGPRDTQAPQLPSPDYSPVMGRRLKSALKSSYM